jgi:carbamoyltransferase
MYPILGISGLYHDSAAAILIDGEIIAAAQEERFTRVKHDASFPNNAINYVLEEAHLNLSDVKKIAFYEKPFLKFERLLESYVANAPYGFNSFRMAMPIWLREKLFLKNLILKELQKLDSTLDESRLLFGEHHLSHAASAFFPSPFNEAIILTMDGVGEWATSSIAIGKGNEISIKKEIHFPHSLGLLYSAFTYYLGFKVNSGEYKIMGLAPYGKPKYKDLIFKKLIDLKNDGSFRMNQLYFNYSTGLTMTNRKFSKLFGYSRRKPESDNLTQFHMDIAASIQAVAEEVILKIVKFASNEYEIPNLCLAGGVALNCVANGKIVKEKVFKEVWVQPASGDAGGALGVALSVWHQELNMQRKETYTDQMKGAYLGPSFDDKSIEVALRKLNANYKMVDQETMLDYTAAKISKGKAVGWFQGRMEFGPRALGNRSILGDPRSSKMQKNLNLKVKFRESFRPFAPSIIFEELQEWFDLDQESPYMLLVDHVNADKQIKMSEKEKKLFGIEKLNIKRSKIPSVTHVDYSARIQTVHNKTNPLYYSLIKKFKEITGCPVLINTSFNVRGEPIVCTPKDAFNCFMGTNMDNLIIGNFILNKEDQDQSLLSNYKDKYELD